MSSQFIVRSQGQNHPLNLKLLLHDGISISKLCEGGITVLEVSDVDAVIELVVRRKSPADTPTTATSVAISHGDKTHPSGANKKSRDDHPAKAGTKNCRKAVREKSPPKPKFKWDSNWMANYNELVTYKSQFGNCNVRVDDEENSKLGNWVQRQRREYKDKNLPEDRISKLNEIGFVWSCRESWETRFNEFVEYKREFGHCHIPLRYKRNPELGKWVNHQRNSYRKYMTEGEEHSNLTQDRIDRLNAIGFIWKVEPKWSTRFSELVEYKREHGDCNVPSKYKPNPKLGIWVYRHRTEFKKGGLSQEHIKKCKSS
jgi:hypothetical protein